LIHTAKGEFFRQAFRSAFERLEIPVIGIRACDLDDSAQKAFSKAAPRFTRELMAWDVASAPGAHWSMRRRMRAVTFRVCAGQNDGGGKRSCLFVFGPGDAP
jgi:hypothetical protein